MIYPIEIREVWEENLEEEFKVIREVVEDLRLSAIDTEFPGRLQYDPEGRIGREHYKILKHNVDKTKLIRLGFTFSDENGNLPTCETDNRVIWQFNFREFDPDVVQKVEGSIEMLVSAGIDFMKNKVRGVISDHFKDLMQSSGVVSVNAPASIIWVSCHGTYDFAYLLKILTGNNLPAASGKFFAMIKTYFPCGF
ncbi:hypothetical protein Droror1_Dr00017251 [Drosera rotundifolia]